MGLAGKTIERVEDRYYDGQRVWFTDGTCADFGPTGYEADGVEVKEKSLEDLERDRVEAIQEAYRKQVEKERAARRREAQRAEMERLLTPKQYETWLAERGTAAGFSKVMKEEFEGAIRAQMQDANRLFFG